MKKILLIVAAMTAVAMVSCKKDPAKDETKENTGGIDVAKENLVAYLSFDDETVQKGADITFASKEGSAELAKGIRGKAYSNSKATTTDKAYLVYNLGANNPFKSLSSFTVSVWVKVPASAGTGSMFSVNGGDATMSNLMLFREGGSDKDGIDIKAYLYNSTTKWKGQDIRLKNEAFEVDKWFLLGYTYDENTSTMTLWANGVKIGDSIRYADEKPEVGEQPLLGKLTLQPNMTKLYFGAWTKQVETNAADDWMGYYPGALDEFRLFNKALSEAEMLALYKAEVAAID